MEEHRASLAHVLLKDPKMDLEGAVHDLRQRLNTALETLGSHATVEVIVEGDHLRFQPRVDSDDQELKQHVEGAFSRVKAEWIRDLNADIDAR